MKHERLKKHHARRDAENDRRLAETINAADRRQPTNTVQTPLETPLKPAQTAGEGMKMSGIAATLELKLAEQRKQNWSRYRELLTQTHQPGVIDELMTLAAKLGRGPQDIDRDAQAYSQAVIFKDSGACLHAAQRDVEKCDAAEIASMAHAKEEVKEVWEKHRAALVRAQEARGQRDAAKQHLSALRDLKLQYPELLADL